MDIENIMTGGWADNSNYV